MKKYTSLSLSRYLAQLSSEKPVPGGGSVSAYVASLAMGLAEMAVQIGSKKAGPDAKSAIEKTLRLLRKTRKDALQVVDLDPQVYRAVLKAYAKARKVSDPEKKNRLIDDALQNSFRLQADLALLIAMAKEGTAALGGVIRGSIENDLRISLKLLDAAFYGAFETARINVVYMKEAGQKSRAEQALEELKKKFETKQDTGN